jgi:alkanesulfonate monooxygenase SsuD/methylene tetrahydromethanopterin reductase-like flavin-dependent oxidoreductase (luciferase family)
MADHFFQMGKLWPAEAPMLEIYTCRGYLAGQTQRIKLVVLVNGVAYHYPGLLAKTATTLDVLSGGRLVFGHGAAWYERECVGLGCPFPRCRNATSGWKRRYKSAARCGVRTTDVTTESTTSSLRRCAPRNRFSGPTRRSSSREPGRKTLRLVAQYADSWNGGFQTVEEAAHKVDVLYRHCDAVGRDPGEIQKTAIMIIDPMADLDGFLRTAERYAALGSGLIDIMPPEDTTDPVAFASRLGEQVIPRVAKIECSPKSRGSRRTTCTRNDGHVKNVVAMSCRVGRHTSKY